jgi:hypothetical protein
MVDGLYIPIETELNNLLQLLKVGLGGGWVGETMGGNVNNVQDRSNQNCLPESPL